MRPTNSVALISVYASSLVSFRGPFIQALCLRDICVYALASDFDSKSREQVISLGATPFDYNLARTGMNAFRDARDCLYLSQLLGRLRPRVSLGYYIKPVIYGTFAAALARVPKRAVLIEGLGSVFTCFGDRETGKRRILRYGVTILYRAALRQAHAIVFLNPDDRREFVERRIAAPERASVLGAIGVDLDDWKYAKPVQDPVTFLFIGRLLKTKGVLDFVEAARLVRAKCPDAQFVMLGDSDSKADAIDKEQVARWAAEGIVSWLGHVDVKPSLLRASVFVLPSYREGIPRSTQEAMAMGRPVITTDVPGCKETVRNGINGFLVPVRDPEALAQAMMHFVRYPESIVSMGIESRRTAEEKFDVRKANEKLLAILGFGPN